MSTFESSSSFAAPVVARSLSTRARALRKTHNYNALTINTTPTYHAKPYFEVYSDGEEEERIRVALTPIADEQHYSMLNSESDEDSTAINVTIQFGWIGAVRNALARVKKSLAALSEQQQKHPLYHRVLSALIIFALFFLVVMFGSSMAATNVVSNRAIVTPSGSSTRVARRPPMMPDNIAPHQESPWHEPPSSIGGAARASPAMRRGTPTPPSDQLHKRQDRLSTTAHVDKPAEAAIPLYGTVSAKFRSLYLRNLKQQHPQLEQQQRGKRERWHPGNLALLFNGGHS